PSAQPKQRAIVSEPVQHVVSISVLSARFGHENIIRHAPPFAKLTKRSRARIDPARLVTTWCLVTAGVGAENGPKAAYYRRRVRVHDGDSPQNICGPRKLASPGRSSVVGVQNVSANCHPMHRVRERDAVDASRGTGVLLNPCGAAVHRSDDVPS